VSEELLNVWDYERVAETTLAPGPYAYFAAGAGDEWTLRENVAAYARWTLRPRVLCDVEAVSTATTVLATPVALPLLVAPMAFQRLAHADGEEGMARAAAAAGTIMCLSTISTATPAAVAAAAPAAPRWFQLYVFKDREVTRSFVEQARDAGFAALLLTADTPYLGRRERDVRTGWKIPADVEVPAMVAALGAMRSMTVAEQFELVSPSVSWRDVEWLATESSLPIVVKGVQTAEDARLAVDHGAAGVVVSNHGGRQLDGVPATLEILPEVVDEVGGRVEVLLDGGIRRGTDIVKALALGARAVLAGRAVLWGLVVGGEAGARRVLELLREELWLALALCGCTTPAEVTPDHARRAS
jgi:isopentenyl diphosphate isomerase/L-lactate dehydrogenase-like FMN-dependent dehydrogenase